MEISDFGNVEDLTENLEAQYVRFVDYIETTVQEFFHSFSTCKYIEEQENYKYSIFRDARESLSNKLWKSKDIGTGSIQKAVVSSIPTKVYHGSHNMENNLVDWRKREDFSKLPRSRFLEEIFFNFYKSKIPESEVFQQLQEEGLSYQIIAYLFFIKDSKRFLPISQEKFDKIFTLIGIPNFKTSGSLSWDNYAEFCNTVKKVRLFLLTKDENATLIDAHSFLWILGNQMNESSLLDSKHHVETNKPEEAGNQTSTRVDPKSNLSASDIHWYKNVNNRETGTAYLDLEIDKFVLHFPTRHGKNALSPKVGEIILLGQRLNGIQVFTHLVSPIDDVLVENQGEPEYQFGRNVQIVAKRYVDTAIPVYTTLWKDVNFQGISQGNVCRIDNVREITNIEELQKDVWDHFFDHKRRSTNREQRAFQCWTILVQRAKENQPITYGELGEAIGSVAIAVGDVLKLIEQYCVENMLPPLTILAVNQTTQLPGIGFTAWSLSDIDEGRKRVQRENWDNLENPFQYAKDGMTKEELVEKVLASPDKSSDVFALVKVRGAVQRIFRDILLRAYPHGCAFCGLSYTDALDAAHIIPYSDSTKEQKMDVRNGMLLCSTHHKLFDKGLIRIDQNYAISITDSCINTGEYDELLTTKLDGKLLRLPEDQKFYPNKEWLLEGQSKKPDALDK